MSVNGGALSLYDAIQVDANFGDFGFDLFTFSGSITGADSVAIRFAPRNAGQGSTGNLHVNGLTVNGSISNVPEPGSLAFCGVVGILAMLRRRK